MPGIMMCYWGPAAWNTLHSFAHRSPHHFTEEERADWRTFLYLVAKFLPCPKCRTHFVDFLDRRIEDGLDGRASLVSLLNDAHNEVNARTGKRIYSLQEHYRVYRRPSSPNPTLKCVTVSVVVLATVLAVEAWSRRTRRLQNAMFLFHAALAIVTLSVGNVALSVDVYKTRIDFRYVNTSNLTQGEDRPWELIPVFEADGSLPFTVLVASFFLLSALFHFLNATLLRSFYLRELAACRTPTRWIEYFFSAPVVLVAVAYTLGIRDRALFLALAGLVATTMPFGYFVEVLARPRSPDSWSTPLSWRLLPWALGHVPQVVAWLLIVLQFYDGADLQDKAPWFVHVILWAELVLFFSFGLASLLSQVLAPKYFYRGELAFQLLSLLSKGLLGLLLLANVLMLSRFEDLYEA